MFTLAKHIVHHSILGVGASAGSSFVSPLTARGDLLTRDASTHVRLPIGAPGTIAYSDGTDPSWATLSTAGIVAGSGTLNTIPMWTPDGSTLGDSTLRDDGANGILSGGYNLGSPAEPWGDINTASSLVGILNGFTFETADGVGAHAERFALETNTDDARAWWRRTNVIMDPLTGGGASELRFTAPSSSSRYSAFKAQAQASTITYTLPATDAAGGLTSNGSGALSWVAYQPLHANLTSWAAITRASGFDTFAATPTSANLASLVTDENGTGKLIFADGTLAIASGKTLTASNTLTFTGTDGSSVAFGTGGTVSYATGANPTASVGLAAVNGSAATFMRSDGAPALDVGIVPTWTGVHTFSAQDVHNAGVSLGTSGQLRSAVADAASAIALLYKPSVALTSGTDRFLHSFQNSAGTVTLCNKADGTWEFGGSVTSGGYINVAPTTPADQGINFLALHSGDGTSTFGVANTYTGAYFQAKDATGATATSLVGGTFYGTGALLTAAITYSGLWGGWFKGESLLASTITEMGGWKVFGNVLGAHSVGKPTTWYGGYIAASGGALTSAYGLFLEQQTAAATNNIGLWCAGTTAGYKAVCIGSTTNFIAPESSTAMSLNTTTLTLKGTNIGLYATAAVAQYATTGTVTGYTGGGGTALTHSDTFTGNTGATAYTIGDIVRALKLIGVMTA